MVIDACLVDTNVLLRIPKRSDPNHPVLHTCHTCITLVS